VLLRLVEAIVLFNLAQVLCDLIAANIGPYANVYRQRMVETHELHVVRAAKYEISRKRSDRSRVGDGHEFGRGHGTERDIPAGAGIGSQAAGHDAR